MRSLDNALKKKSPKPSEELYDEMQITKPKQTALNGDNGSFTSVYSPEKSLNLSKSVFDSQAVFKTKDE